jgi:hypothetical protein
MVTMTSPAATSIPAASAAALPKFLRRRTTRTLRCAVRTVGRPVVDEHDLPLELRGCECLLELPVQLL